MPLTAKYTWVESQTTVQLQVPLKGQPISKVDVFATECYLKVSFPPYLLELDLDGCIDSMQPRARVENGTLMIKARKKEGHIGLWGSLGKLVDRKCDPKVKARREESIKEKLKQEQELKERVSLRKHQDERLALRSQMSVEEDERRRIEDIKAEQKEKEEADVYRAFAELAAKQNRGGSTALDEPPATATAQSKEPGGREKRRQLPMPPSPTCSSMRDHLGTIDEGGSEEGSFIPPTTDSSAVPAAKLEAESSIWEDETGSRIDDEEAGGDRDDGGESKVTADSASGSSDQQQGRQQPLNDDDNAEEKVYRNKICNGDDDDDTPVRYTPAPRASVGVVPVGFTTRLFPTPLRESKVADESAWIMKNRRHLHKNKSLVGRLPAADSQSAGGGRGGGGRDGLPIDISETDPVWLKGKGDDLYRGGDFLGAVNAYTAALDADPMAAACLSNRAACYLCLSSTGGGNGNDRSRYASDCVADCGAALDILRALPETGPSQAKVLARRSLAYRELGHYGSSLEDCRAALLFSPGDAALLKQIARGEPLARAEACKKEAATRFASRDVHGACELYTAALKAVPSFPSALSNRAACYLALGKPRDCVRDCTAVLDMLSFSVADKSRGRISGDNTRTTSDALTAAGPSEEHMAAARDGTPAPSSSPPLPPPPAGFMPPPGSEKRTKWVLTTVVRRARAKVQLEDYEGALQDYRAADYVSPGNKEVEKDLRELERKVGRDVERKVERKPLQPLDPAAS
eukprot:g8368.t1